MIKKYLITSREFYTDTPAVFRKTVHKQFTKHLPDFALYRDKSNPNYDKLAEDFVEVCKEFGGVKSFIHQKTDLAVALGASGVHLTSSQFDDIEYAKSRGLEVIISTHTYKEVFKAQELGADYVTYSPVFYSPGKGEPKGLDDLKGLINQCSIKVFALGGIIDQKQIGPVEDAGAYGFASIRYFY